MENQITKKQIADLLKDKRLEAGLTGPEVILRLKLEYGIELSDKTLYGYEKATSAPNIPLFLALCRIYDVDDIFEALGVVKSRKPALTGEQKKLLQYFELSTPEARELALKMLKPEKEDTVSLVG